jgi:Putative member of DMT superfamily (DUF486)
MGPSFSGVVRSNPGEPMVAFERTRGTGFPPSEKPASSTVRAPCGLFGSNVFRNFAWYGHLRLKSYPQLLVILVSWAIAFFEYCLAVPPNR